MRTTLYVLIVMLTVQQSVRAEVIAEYTFSDKALPARSADRVQTSDAEMLVTGDGVEDSGISFSALGKSKPSMLIQNAGFNQTSEVGAMSADDYIGFSVTIQEEERAAISKLEFYTLRRDLDNEGTGAPDRFAIYTSADYFAAPAGSGSIPLKQGDAREFDRQVIDLSSVAALQSVEGSLEFRIYFWTSQGIGTPEQRSLRLDDVSLSGSLLK